MTDVTQPRMARGTMLIAGIVTAAMLALFAFAPLASAASNPVGTDSTATVTLNKGFINGLKKKGVKTSAVAPAKLKGAKLTLKVTGGSIDPATGKGSVNLGGGLKFKAGKKSTTVKRLVLNNTKSGVLGAKLTGNVGGKNVVFATVVGLKSAPNGFGVNLTIKQLKLSGAAATQLNKKLGLKGKAKAFKGNRVMGSAKTEVQPSTLTVQAGGNASLLTEAPTVGKFVGLGVEFIPIAPTTEELTPLPKFGFPVTGGTINPTATAGIVHTGGGIILQGPEVEPSPEKAPGQKTKFSMVLNEIWVDLGTKTASVEVTIKSSNPIFPVPGALGRTSIADIDLSGATITADPTTHAITVSNAKSTLQALTAVVLNEIFAGKAEVFKPGDGLGVFSFTLTTE